MSDVEMGVGTVGWIASFFRKELSHLDGTERSYANME